MAFNFSEDDDKELIYDLRQIYAKDIIGNSLKQIKYARTTEDYPLWYHSLKRDLFTEISQKLTPEEIKLIKIKIKETKNILFIHSNTYIGKNKNPSEHEIIEDALCELEMLLTSLMEKHKMYGSKEDDEGL